MSTYIVADIGSNFVPGDLDTTLEMVRQAADVGVDAVKFQDFHVDVISRSSEWKERCERWEFPVEWRKPISDLAKEKGIDFFVSVFDSEAIESAVAGLSLGNTEYRYSAIKIASSECFNYSLLRQLNKRVHVNASVILSVPSQASDCLDAVGYSLACLNRCQVQLLHCADYYPCEPWQADLSCIHTLAHTFRLPVGWSSHVAYPDAVMVAAKAVKDWGANMVEVHMRTERTPTEAPDNGPWALYPREIVMLVQRIRDIIG